MCNSSGAILHIAGLPIAFDMVLVIPITNRA